MDCEREPIHPIERDKVNLFSNAICPSTTSLATAGGSAGVGGVFLVGRTRAATAAHAICRGAAAGGADGGNFTGAEKMAICVVRAGGGVAVGGAGATAIRL